MEPQANEAAAPEMETKQYSDGTQATGVAPLSEASPEAPAITDHTHDAQIGTGSAPASEGQSESDPVAGEPVDVVHNEEAGITTAGDSVGHVAIAIAPTPEVVHAPSLRMRIVALLHGILVRALTDGETFLAEVENLVWPGHDDSGDKASK
jgi:hypothetical protein